MDRRDFLQTAVYGTGGLALSPFAAYKRRSERSATPKRLSFARTFYVNSREGDDRNEGTAPAKAWRSLRRVNKEEFRPGDRILFRAGTHYQGQLKPNGSGAVVDGTPQPIVIDRYGDGPSPQLKGEGEVAYTLYLYNVEYWEVNNLAISNEGAEREPGRRGICVHAQDFGTARHIHLRGLHIHDVNGSLVKQKGHGGGILWHNEGANTKTRFDGLLIEDCHIERCTRNAINSRGYTRRDEWHPSKNVRIRNNLIEGVPGDGIVPIGCDGAIVEGNVMRNCPRQLPDGEAAAGIWPWSSDNTVIQFNEVSGHKAPWDAQGFDSDWNCRGTVIQYNYSHDNEGGFLLACNNGGATMPRSTGNEDSVIRYNISVNDGLKRRPTERRGLFSPTFHITGPIKRTRIYNNLIAVTKTPEEGGHHAILRTDNWGGPWPDDTYFANNIFFVAQGPAWRFHYGEATNTRFDSNLYAGTFTNAPYEHDELEQAAVREEPRFLDRPSEAPSGRKNLDGFQLQSASPAVDAGTRMSDPGQRDFWGNPIPAGSGVDIGPHEVGAS